MTTKTFQPLTAKSARLLLLQAAIALDEMILSLAGESSVIDEDLENSQALADLRRAIAKLTDC